MRCVSCDNLKVTVSKPNRNCGKNKLNLNSANLCFGYDCLSRTVGKHNSGLLTLTPVPQALLVVCSSCPCKMGAKAETEHSTDSMHLNKLVLAVCRV